MSDDSLRAIPDYSDWGKLERKLPSENAKKLCELAKRQQRHINLIKKQYRRGKRVLDPVRVSKIDQLTEAIIRHILSMCRKELEDDEETNKIEQNLKTIRQSIRASVDSFSVSEAEGIVKYLRDHYNLLNSIVYTALATTKSEVTSKTDRKLVENLDRKIGVEPEVLTEQQKRQAGIIE